MIDATNLLPTAVSVAKANLGKRIPLKVTQYITHRCNLTCEYCGRYNLGIPELSTEQAKYYISEFHKLGTRFWSFNGGECLVRKDLGELIEHVKNLGMQCNIVTNGLLVPHRIEWLKKLDLVATSIDGPEEIQDRIRGKGVFKKNVKALQLLAENKIRTVIVSVITKENYNKLEVVLKLAEEYGHQIEFQPVITHQSGKNQENVKKYQFELGQFEEAVAWIIEQKKKGRPIFTSYEYLDDMKKYPACEANMNCWASRLFCAVGCDGSIYPCAEFVATDKHKHIVKDNDIRQAYLSLPDMSKCNSCYFSCYSEYNLMLNNRVKSFFKAAKNVSQGSWFWS